MHSRDKVRVVFTLKGNEMEPGAIVMMSVAFGGIIGSAAYFFVKMLRMERTKNKSGADD